MCAAAKSVVKPLVEAVWLGRVSYAEGLEIQRRYVDKVVCAKTAEERNPQPSNNYLLLLEHTPVYTVGIRSHCYSEAEEKRLKSLGADFFRTNRGGLITFHGPGQLVAYPIVDLSSVWVREPHEPSGRVGVRRFVNLIEETVIRTVRQFGLTDAGRSPDTGVWLGNGSRKIAAIGISVRRGVTSHGLALNCNTDMEWFKQIVPCGLVGKQVTSLTTELGRDVGVTELIRPLSKRFAEVFQCEVQYPNSDRPMDKALCDAEIRKSVV